VPTSRYLDFSLSVEQKGSTRSCARFYSAKSCRSWVIPLRGSSKEKNWAVRPDAMSRSTNGRLYVAKSYHYMRSYRGV
jgi:hypothetical protein